MSTPAKVERELRETNGRKACIDFSLRTFQPSLYSAMSEGQGFEERYLGKESSRDRNTGILSIPSVIGKVEVTVNDLLISNGLSTLADAQLRDMRREANQEAKRIGLDIKERAEEFGLVTTQTAAQATSLLDEYSGRVFRSEIKEEKEYSYLQSRGWNIHKTENGAFVLLTSAHAEGDEQRFDTVSFDALFNQDPDFVKDKIRRYYELQGIQYIVNRITYNLALHEVDSSTLVPRFFDALSTDMQKREEEIEGLIALLYAFGKIGDYPNRLVNKFVKNLRERSQQILDEQQYTTLPIYLDHLIACPRASESSRQQDILRFDVLDRFASIEVDMLEPPAWEDNSSDAQQQRLLMKPFGYTRGEIEQGRIRIRSQKERDTRFGQFIQDTWDVTNVSEFEEALATTLPDTFSLLERFKVQAGVAYAGKTAFDRFIERATEIFLRDGKEPDQAVKESLSYILLPRDRFSEIHVSRDGIRTIISPELQFLLPLMVLKSAQVQAPHAVGERLQVISTRYEKSVNDADAILMKLNQHEELMKAILIQYRIPEATIARLATSVKPIDGKKGRPNDTAFTFAFLALLFSERLDRTSPAFRAMAKDVYPTINDETLNILQEGS